MVRPEIEIRNEIDRLEKLNQDYEGDMFPVPQGIARIEGQIKALQWTLDPKAEL